MELRSFQFLKQQITKRSTAKSLKLAELPRLCILKQLRESLVVVKIVYFPKKERTFIDTQYEILRIFPRIERTYS